MRPVSPAYRLWAVLVGLTPFLAVVPLLKLWALLNAQLSPSRWLGLMACLSALIIGCTGIVALVASRFRPGETFDRALRTGAVGLVAINLALAGLVVFYQHPLLAPRPWLAASVALPVVLMLAFWRYSPGERAFVFGSVVKAGLAVVALPLLALPLVAWGAATDRPRLPAAPPVAGGAVRPEAPKRIVLVTFDALRARSTSVYTPTLDNTPHLEALARESHVYLNMRAAGDRTLVSMPTVLTGVPPQHYIPHLSNPGFVNREGALTSLAGHLAAAGYTAYYATDFVEPAMFGAAGEFAGGLSLNIENRFRFNQKAYLPLGEVFEWAAARASGRWGIEPAVSHVLATRRLFDEGLARLQQAPDRTFLWVHLGVPHMPIYRVPRADMGQTLHPDRYPILAAFQLQNATPEQLAGFERDYEEYIRFADAELGRFLDGLKRQGLWDDTMVVVTADHGSDFTVPKFPHSEGLAREDIAHVPLLIHEAQQREGHRHPVLAGHQDLVPTLLDRVYREPPPGFVGHPLLAGAPPGDRMLMTWALTDEYIRTPGTAVSLAAYRDRWRYFVQTRPLAEEGLFDLLRDPRAAQDVQSSHPEVVEDFRRRTAEALTP